MSAVRVEVTRGGHVESVHEIDLAVVDDRGAEVASAGRPGDPVFSRSAIKPFQALPLVEDGAADRFGLTPEELALCCASHSGEDRHVELARSILGKAGLDESALACGPHMPFGESPSRALRAAGLAPGRIHNNCSGKHAGMLALARAHGWPTEEYQQPGHPVQQRMLDEMARWTGEPRDRIGTGVDGCGVVTFEVPLTALAGAFAGLAAAAERGESGPARILGSMADHPHVVGGTNRLCTRLAEVTEGRVLAKVGAEGVYGAIVPQRALGVALKVRDGARRAAEVGLLAVLDALGLVGSDAMEALRPWARPDVTNTRGERVGEVRAVVELDAADAAAAGVERVAGADR